MEEFSCRQKSMALWLKEGDKCTKFFIGWLTRIGETPPLKRWQVDGLVSFDQFVIR
jgi:hypothetical protein